MDAGSSSLASIELGRYELPRRTGDAYLYRVHHPLALWVIQQAKTRTLAGARLVFDYEGYGTKISTLGPNRGKVGWLTIKLISVEENGRASCREMVVKYGLARGVEGLLKKK